MPDLFTEATAELSPCGRFRYRLTRTWDSRLPTALFVMLNPSRADAEQDDPTITRCLGFARAWGCGALVVVNLYAYRATDPADLAAAGHPVGPDNFRHVLDAIEVDKPGLVVCAWGAHRLTPLGTEMVKRVRMTGRELHCLGLTKTGHPRHPLFVRGDQPLVAYAPKEADVAPRRLLHVPYVPPQEVRRRLCERLGFSEDAPDEALLDALAEREDVWACNEAEAGLPGEG